ncbi:MAG: hypothetical protein JJU28_15325 [Cyclobacteriaceae bacterium]|nr:hypothetical protein [Cyclobacteriaceae bacterium]
MKLSVAKNVHIVEPNDFEPTDHWYPRVLNSNLHPLVTMFLNLDNSLIAERYCRLVPNANPKAISDLLNYQPVYFRWAGTDMMYITNKLGQRKLTLIETNSCPSGQKSMPLLFENLQQGGYQRLIEETFKPMVDPLEEDGVLAVFYDKNPMENIGYAASIADIFKEEVHLAYYTKDDEQPPVKITDNKFFVQSDNNQWLPVRAAFRYVTQDPWNRIPKDCKTKLLNPIEACLAGGRNKEIAYNAYIEFNKKFKEKGLSIHTPKTFVNVGLKELKVYLNDLKGNMVVKVPESNAGQGVYTITSEREFEAMYQQIARYPDSKYIVQELIKSNPSAEDDMTNTWYHLGTVPDFKERSYAFDIRMMIHSTSKGFRPLAAYSRRSRYPLNFPPPEGLDSWQIYGTNLSVKSDSGWEYDDERLLIFDRKNYGALGIGLNELILGFIQSCMAIYAVDQQAKKMFES